ncbi:fibronectin type III domain-containing protein [Aquimarina gracilis]|uniref:Fibronectin type III domain-containing protein n=1 Tax=Aquimarina gracilis TaxID=874422 RepID=A0ABU5ZSX5_9FLAO|nr:fibronectin type III domain-containing protein [Aquimarina gracilis]MEB3344386.1 fibronectin type III domain-containing protein [Aquimarina gracilis]
MTKSIKIYIALLSTALVLSCSGDDDGGPQIDLSNADPTIPSLIFPTNNLTCTNIDLTFSWNAATDSDGDTISYVIDISTDSSFDTIAFTVTTTQRNRTFNLDKGVTYFWRVKAMDNKGNESDYSATQSFFTEPDAAVNTLPNAPEVVSPEIGSRVSETTITLNWNASDADGDTLVYDVYFGDTDSPALVAEAIDVSTLDVSVSSGTTYYWRVVAKDPNQSATMGQLWNFRTE